MHKLLIVLLAAAGCQHLGAGSEVCAGAVARDRLPGEYSLHVRARLVRGDETQRHEAIVEVSDSVVTLVGLTPLGTQAYSLTLDDAGSDLDNRIGRHLGLDPRALLDAIARAWIAPRERTGAAELSNSGERLLPGPEAGAWRYVDRSGAPRAEVQPLTNGSRVVSGLCSYEARLIHLERGVDG